jgi:hypothetical protein
MLSKRREPSKFHLGFHILFDNIDWNILSQSKLINMVNYTLVANRVDFSGFDTMKPR